MLPFQGAYRTNSKTQGVALGWVIKGFQPFPPTGITNRSINKRVNQYIKELNLVEN
jgi:hypothetical protein